MGTSAEVTGLVRPPVQLRVYRTYGWASPASPSGRRSTPWARPALLVHSRGDSQVFFASLALLVRHASPHGETWVREGYQYMILPPESFLDPAADVEHADRILGFPDQHFGRPRTG